MTISIVKRRARSDLVKSALREHPAVVLTGLPSVGRSLFSQEYGKRMGEKISVFDGSKESQLQNIINQHQESVNIGSLIVIDHIAESAIQTVIDIVRAAGHNSRKKFILLPRYQWIDNSFREGLTGLCRFVELPPIQPDETRGIPGETIGGSGPLIMVTASPQQSEAPASLSQETHWLRGGIPVSLFNEDEEASFNWRQAYIDTLLKGNLRRWNIEPADRMFEIFTRLVKNQGRQFDVIKCASELQIKRTQVETVLDYLERIGLVRRLSNWVGNGLPVTQIRDSGLFHAAAGIRTLDHLKQDDQVYGHSWECFASEALIMASGSFARPYFYCNSASEEIDLVIDYRPTFNCRFAIEFKVNDKARAESGFEKACDHLSPTHKLVVHSGSLRRSINGIEYMALTEAINLIRTQVS